MEVEEILTRRKERKKRDAKILPQAHGGARRYTPLLARITVMCKIPPPLDLFLLSPLRT